jgi:hypothetical protein
MSNVSIVKIKVRRGTDAERRQVTLDQGELGFTTDYQRFFIGDGATVGGISPAIKFYVVNQNLLSAYPTNQSPVQLNDIVYDTYSTCFYTLTGTPNTNLPSSYQILRILTPTNARTLLSTSSAGLATGSLWIDQTTKTLKVI